MMQLRRLLWTEAEKWAVYEKKSGVNGRFFFFKKNILSPILWPMGAVQKPSLRFLTLLRGGRGDCDCCIHVCINVLWVAGKGPEWLPLPLRSRYPIHTCTISLTVPYVNLHSLGSQWGGSHPVFKVADFAESWRVMRKTRPAYYTAKPPQQNPSH